MDWIERVSRKVISWFSQREVKTPLSFFFRIVGAVTITVLIAIYLADPAFRFRIFLTAIAVLVFLTVVVALFAWFRPKNLVYGESGHRAELKLSLGTENSEIEPSDLAAMKGAPNPKALSDGGGAA